MTEISVSLARITSTMVSTVLVDLDSVWPAVAQRLDLPPHPNIRTAIDHVLHRVDRLPDAIHNVEELMVVGGRADGGQGPEISRADALMLIDGLGGLSEVIVADLGPLRSVSAGLLREFDTVVLVGEATPVGVARLIRSAGSVVAARSSWSVLAVANKVARGAFRRSEILAEVDRCVPGLPVVTVPYDPDLQQAVWDGTLLSKGRYVKAVSAMSDLVVRSLG